MHRYKSHVAEEYKIESIFNNTDSHIITGSEDGRIVIYDLVTVWHYPVVHPRARWKPLCDIILFLCAVCVNTLLVTLYLLAHLMGQSLYGSFTFVTNTENNFTHFWMKTRYGKGILLLSTACLGHTAAFVKVNLPLRYIHPSIGPPCANDTQFCAEHMLSGTSAFPAIQSSLHPYIGLHKALPPLSCSSETKGNSP